MVPEFPGLRIKRFPVNDRKIRTLDMCNEIALGTLGNNGDLRARFAEGCQWLAQRQFPSRVGTGKNLYRPARFGTGLRFGCVVAGASRDIAGS
jgi:hypothetical protein